MNFDSCGSLSVPDSLVIVNDRTSINQSIDLLIDQLFNQSLNLSVNPSINQKYIKNTLNGSHIDGVKTAVLNLFSVSTLG